MGPRIFLIATVPMFGGPGLKFRPDVFSDPRRVSTFFSLLTIKVAALKLDTIAAVHAAASS